ncbi:MAG: hypothetical protein ACM30G_16790 [Micromonosporaceae bacterium]
MSEPGAPAPTGVPELALRAAGLVVAVWGAVLLALVGAFLTPLRFGGVLIPVSIPLAIAGNLVLTWFVGSTTGRRGLALVPGLAWVGLSLVAAGRTTEGDLLVTNWVGPVAVLAGAATLGLGLFRGSRGRA